MEPLSVSQGDHLLLRKGVYYYRRRVPDFAHERLGKKEIVQSLQTKSLSEAKRLRNQLDARYEQIFGNAPVTGEVSAPVKPMAESVGPTHWAAVGDHLQGMADKARHMFFECPPDSNEDRLNREEEVGTNIQVLKDRDDLRADQMVAAVFRTTFGKDWVSVAANAALGEAVRRGLLALEYQKLERIECRGDLEFRSPNPSASSHAGLTFAEMGADYLAVVKKTGEANATNLKWLDKQAGHVEVLNEIIGRSTLVGEVNFNRCERVQMTLAELPAHREKRFPGLSLADATALAARAGAPLLSATTQNGYLATLTNILDRALKQGHLPTNPAAGMKALKRHTQRPEDRRLPFTSGQLEGLFHGPFYRSCAEKGWRTDPKGWRFWLPLLTAYMGLRPNESCQLEVADLKITDQGIHYLDFTAQDEDENLPAKQLKTHSSRRRVPIHPALISIGILEFVAHRRAQGKSRLFPTLKPDKYGNYAKYPLKQFREVYFKALGLGRRQSFYSLRHNFRDGLRETDAPGDVLEGVAGWKQAGSNVSDNYGERLKPDYTVRWLRQVRYVGIDLSFLYDQELE